MALVPTTQGPSVAESAQPTPEQRIDAPAGAFGPAVVGQGLSEVGKAATQTSDTLSAYAQTYQAINNKQAADTGFANYTQKQDQMVADFKANNTGVDPKTGLPSAMTNMPGLYKDLETLRTDTGSGLSPMAQVEYEANTRRALSYAQSEVTNFAVDQRKAALVSTQLSLIKLAQDDAAANIDDPNRVNSDIAQIAQAHATLSTPQYNGTPTETSQALLRTDVGAIYASASKQKLDAGDIPGAQAIFSAHKDDMTFEQSTALAGALKSGAKDFVVQGNAQGILAGQPITDTRPQVAGASNDIAHAILGQESGGNPNVHASSAGAIGIGQITPATFAQFAKPGEVITNPADNAAVSARIVDFYTQAYKGDPARVAVAYFSGPGNVAPPGSPTPWKRDVKDTDGTSTSAYVNGVEGRLGVATSNRVIAPPPPPISPNEDPNTAKAAYDTYIQTWAPKVFADDPALAAKVMEADRSAMNVRIQALAAGQAAASARLTNAITGGTTTGNAVSDMGSLATAYPGAADDIRLLPPAAQSEIQQHINMAAAGYGGYKSVTMTANAQTLEGLRLADPAKFADQTQTNLTTMQLSAADRLKYMAAQDTTRKQLATEQDHLQQSLGRYLANPIVQAAIIHTWPTAAAQNDPSSGYLSFLGAMQGKIEALGEKEGKPPGQDEITAAAQQLLLSHPQGFGHAAIIGAQDIPADAQAKITAAYVKATGSGPTPDQMSYAFQKGPSYYAQ